MQMLKTVLDFGILNEAYTFHYFLSELKHIEICTIFSHGSRTLRNVGKFLKNINHQKFHFQIDITRPSAHSRRSRSFYFWLKSGTQHMTFRG